MMADTNTDNNVSEKRGKRFFRKRGRGFHNKNQNYESSCSAGSKYRSKYNESHRGGFRDSNFGRKPYKRVWLNVEGDVKRKRFKVGDRLKEPDIGVTEFISDHSGFSGLLKERYSDFHVNEISLDGKIAKLTNQTIPIEPTKPEDTESMEVLKTHIPDTIWEQLQTLKNEELVSSKIEIDVTNMDKDGRRTIHEIARKLTNVTSKTTDHNGKKLMTLIKCDKNKKNVHRSRNDDKVNWEKLGGIYCYFMLHKMNMDTMGALNQMSKVLHVSSHNFNYAGTKDRRAWTTQWVSLKKGHPNSILRAAKLIPGVFVGNFKFAKEPLKLGMLRGNRFRIALRNVTAPDEDIEKAMTSLRDHGFINYYGLQRFGTVPTIPTHEIGKKLLQGKWKEAIELILKPRDGEQDSGLAEARKIYEETKDAWLAYKKIESSGKVEAELLKGLSKNSQTNPQGALDMIPRNARLMYIHAYQSFVWNHMVSRRIKEFGTHPIVGDLVYENDIEDIDPVDNGEHLCQNNSENTSLKNNETDTTIKENDTNKEVVEVENTSEKDDIREPVDDTKANTNVAAASDIKDSIDNKQDDVKTLENSDQKDSIHDIKKITNTTENSLKIKEKVDVNSTAEDKDEVETVYNLPSVKVLTEEDLANYTLADVVMPQPGWKVTYPPYAKPWFDEFLNKDELTTDLSQKNKKYSLGGTYRKILEIPSDLSWKIMHYKDKYNNLIASDLDEMREVKPPKDDPQGERKALIVEMSLKSSTYATMALREILKQDTSAQAQAAQSAAYDALSENKNAVDTAEKNSNDENIQTTIVDQEPEKDDSINKQMNIDPVLEEPVSKEESEKQD